MQQTKMTLHYSSQPVLKYRYNKIKSVMNILKIDYINQQPKQIFTNLPQICTIAVLPLLQDPQNKLQLTSSNSIIRYLASISGEGKLYGNDNNYNKSLIDQWLDFSACQLDSLAFAVQLFLSGREVDIQIVFAEADKALTGLNKGLNKKKYLVGDTLSIADLVLAITISPILAHLYTELQRKKFTHIVNWFLGIAAENKNVQPKQLSPKAHIKIQKYKNKGQKGKKQEKDRNQQNKDKKQKKPNKYSKKDQKAVNPDKKQDKTGGDDLFDDDNTAGVQVKKPQVVKKEQKKKAAAKSIVVFDVKVYEEEQDLEALFKKITTEIVMEGLVWNKQSKIMPVAYTMNKLQIGCVIEDEKVSVEQDIFQKIRGWEDEIQSVDTVSFQKL